MNLGIQGKKALVWGASRGLGKAAALQLTQEGVEVTLLSRTPQALHEAQESILLQTGVRPNAVVADITTEAGRQAAIAACPAPDILINNASGPTPGDFREWQRQDWLDALDSMMLGPIAMMRLTVDGMAERGFGRIINITSRSVKIPQLELGLSNSARSGLTGFVAGLARTQVHRNVTINNILPGIFDTEGQWHHIQSLSEQTGRDFSAIHKERAAANPAQRYGKPEEFGATCAFLCSQQAGFITGQNLLIDGGSYPGTF
ncbi:SDR family oxidoreductase [Candidatus Symbiopectobacterium sp. NZEC127]|uniref:SDR family oxidoreductase n=1 Tax=Candidatus Symbiopectobacterium sp. NZEC127 TaxID=2820472 RepID=UPI0022270510|nr:SDR family oxidoreductase [Candidatus Symbiopectobacterium sp. NZEC127]MCW2487343.1 SDR family oxidoreductase [Candidatus Symbiopectobacterium sp. NZEC127]